MQATRIKICGVTNPPDALVAAHAGADAVGMVFHASSKRGITIEQAREILAALPPFVTPVGLFVDQPNDVIRQTVAALGLRHVQLHGHESPRQIGELRGLVILKAVRVVKGDFINELNRWKQAIAAERLDNLRGLVLETDTPQAGGSGVGNDWDTVAAAKESGALAGLPPIIAAGGLTAASVADVVSRLHPWAVDVSSGVEDTPGQKSIEKIHAFIRAVRGADATQNANQA